MTSNSISEGDTREATLDILPKNGVVVYRVRTARPWPGDASVFICDIHLSRGVDHADKFIDARRVAFISPFLDEFDSSAITAIPSNKELWFKGTGLGGEYFECTAERDSLEPNWVKGYCNGKELNALHVILPPRWVIDFTTMESAPEAPTGKAGKLLLRKALDHFGVKKAEDLPRNWFRFRRSAAALYRAIEGLPRVIVRAQTSSTWAFVFVPSDWVFDQKQVVFASASAALFAALQSTVHRLWVDRFGGTLRSDLSYNPSDCFESFPLPVRPPNYPHAQLAAVGERFHAVRAGIMTKKECGLTTLMHWFDDPERQDPATKTLRESFREIDEALVAAYGWDGLRLDHGFHETKQGVRYTIGDAARVEILGRLLALNQQGDNEVSAPRPAAKTGPRSRSAPLADGAPKGAVKRGTKKPARDSGKQTSMLQEDD